MDGMQMLLKAFGLNADELKKTAADWFAKAQQTINYFVGRHNTTDATLARLEQKLDAVLSDRFDYVASDYIAPSANRRWTNEIVTLTGDANDGKPN